MASGEWSADQTSLLQSLAGSRTLPDSIVQLAAIVPAQRVTPTGCRQAYGVRSSTEGTWRQSYLDRGLGGLHHEPRPGRPHSDEDDKVAEVINRALPIKPTHGSTR